jgi:hypothetical protein
MRTLSHTHSHTHTQGSRAILTRNVALITLIHSLEVEDATRAASQLASVTQDFAENAILNQVPYACMCGYVCMCIAYMISMSFVPTTLCVWGVLQEGGISYLYR